MTPDPNSCPNPDPDGRLALAGYQARAVEGIQEAVRKVAEYHGHDPDHRERIAAQSGVMLLQSPTGSGKTLILGRGLEGLRGALERPVVWFWFAPFAGLTAQTRAALNDQCASLRLRDVTTDREVAGTRDGDVFIQTWASVAARNKEARRVRRKAESALSLDETIAALRANGFFVGVVIDEAHLNFGASAKAAAEFYLEVLQPDFTLLATATPNDEKLEGFEKEAGIEVASRIVVPRFEVVGAGLNKRGLMLGVIRFREEDRDLIDHEQATLTAAWTQHKRVEERLNERGLAVAPLMLVQVEDQAAGGDDPVARVHGKLVEAGVPEEAIARHTSGQPDPDFHTLACDPEKRVLIFKVAVATGFDAPRAWTLVSVRPNRSRDFGLQIVGRIMRVHPAVRPVHGTDPLLDRGYVFLTDTEMQEGLDRAVEELKAVRQSISLVTDRLDVVEFGNAAPLDSPKSRRLPGVAPEPPQTEEERQQRLNDLIEDGLVPETVRNLPEERQDAAIAAGEAVKGGALFDDLPHQQAPAGPEVARPHGDGEVRYPLRTDLDLPEGLIRELPPEPGDDAGLVEDIAREFCEDPQVIQLLQKKLSMAELSLRDLFLEDRDQETLDLRLRLSNARIAEKAQAAFSFNDSIDPRALKRSLVQALRATADREGIEADENDLRRAVDLAAMSHREKLMDAMKAAQARRVRRSDSVPIPNEYFGPAGLAPCKKGAYPVFPDRMNAEERAFAEVLDNDSTGTVKWWLRNPENAGWATRLLLPSGRNFFPDFAVGVKGRSTPNGIALVEIKDDGETGRLQSDRNIEKIRVQHRDYRRVHWTYRLDGTWAKAHYDQGLNRITELGKFEIAEMVMIE